MGTVRGPMKELEQRPADLGLEAEVRGEGRAREKRRLRGQWTIPHGRTTAEQVVESRSRPTPLGLGCLRTQKNTESSEEEALGCIGCRGLLKPRPGSHTEVEARIRSCVLSETGKGEKQHGRL